MLNDRSLRYTTRAQWFIDKWTCPMCSGRRWRLLRAMCNPCFRRLIH